MHQVGYQDGVDAHAGYLCSELAAAVTKAGISECHALILFFLTVNP